MADEPKEENKDEEQEKHAGGRPLKFQSVEELDKAINQYFQSRDPYIAKTQRKVLKNDGTIFWQEDEELIPERPKTMSGLARALDCSRQTLVNYKGKPEFFDSISRAINQCQEYAEEKLYTPGIANGAKFALMNNYEGWADRVDQSTPENPIPLLAGLAPKKLEVDNAETDSDNSADEDKPA